MLGRIQSQPVFRILDPGWSLRLLHGQWPTWSARSGPSQVAPRVVPSLDWLPTCRPTLRSVLQATLGGSRQHDGARFVYVDLYEPNNS